MNVAITGATGFVGRYIVRHLVGSGHMLRCWCRPASDRSGLEPLAASIEWMEGELGSQQDSEALVTGCDAVVHAALHHVSRGFQRSEGEIIEFVEKNVVGTLKLIEAARKANVARFVFISTCAVYDKILPDRPLDETHPLWPNRHYGAHKAAIEKFVHSYGYDMGYPICALRPTGVYGVAHLPEFGEGTRKVLTSEVSHMWPISDAGLGALAYTIEFLMAWMGGKTRWRTMPWMVTFFFILVVPLGLTHIILVILQPVAVGQWCTLCLAAAFVMLVMIPFTIDEVVAMGQFLAWSARQGKPLWRTFWVGGTMEGGGPDERTATYGAPLQKMAPAMLWGVSAPWTLVVSAILGVWMMLAPWAFGTAGKAALGNQVAGALVVTVSFIVMAEVVRAGRLLNLLLGLWFAAVPWLYPGIESVALWNNICIGGAIVLLALPRGQVLERYAGWDRYVM